MIVYQKRMTSRGVVYDHKSVGAYTATVKKSGWLSAKDINELDSKKNDDAVDAEVVEVDTNGNGYNSIPEIKTALDELGVKYKARDSRDVLLDLLQNAQLKD